MIRTIDSKVSVAPQIDPAQMPDIAAAGFVAIVNNRPDDEEPGQPSGAEIQAAAEAAGLAYTAIPVTHAGFGHGQLDAMRAALDAADGPVLAYCRSGTRSCNLWALAEAKAGGDSAELVEKAAGAGYDLSGIRPTLDALSGR
ncbi:MULTISPECIES: TIGR01244 family sulfur transferase [Sphingomonas]|uniref:TIGR01244 family sulfur transferase n=1 Tax=Sphingomonas TaxID=13687 RepID=UPI000F7E1F7D|nr:TIGR01244 family sulfur transferase [Sphingomonas sp. ABOLF]RSV11551.1 TIGR01244 family phosphatase [Sphingomonas sp. ABOLF]GLK22227.1 TIGR01244 family protein [Microbacterium terregens]